MLKAKRIILFFTISLLFSNYTLAQNQSDTVKKIDPLIELKEDIIQLIRESKIDNAIMGIHIKSLDQNQVIFNLNDSKNLIPASLQKLFTTATALRYLGENYKFQTRIYFDGKVNSRGIYKGNIIIRGYGDPTQSILFNQYREQNFFDYFISLLDSLGVSEIDGNIIGDDNFFDDDNYPIGWEINDLNYSYASPIAALSTNRNTIKILIWVNDTDTIPTIKIEPNIDYIEINNFLKIQGEESNFKISKTLGTNIINIIGEIPKTLKIPIEIEVPIDNPTLYFLSILKNYLQNNFINFSGDLLDIDDLDFLPDYDKIKDFNIYYSPELKFIIKEINTKSLNLESEMLLKTIGREVTGFGSTENGLELVKQFLEKINIERNNYYITDGSGLSRQNYISCRSIQKLLEFESKTPYFKRFLNSLARPGEEGTLKYRMQNSAAKKLVYAKTGTLNGISNIAGYVYTRDGELCSVIIMIMNHSLPLQEIHNLQNLIIMRLSAFTRYPEYYKFKN